MAHFAQLDEDNVVQQVIVVSNDDILLNGVEDEATGVAFCQSLFGEDTNWKQTSYNGSIRQNYAGIGSTYVADGDYFRPPAPYPSWVFSTVDYTWHSPLGDYAGEAQAANQADQPRRNIYWDEDAYQADNTTGWVVEENYDPS